MNENGEDFETVKKLLSSAVKLDILALFHNNPGLVDRTEGVARRVGRTEAEIENGLRDLIDLRVLIIKKLGKSEIILFDQSRDSELQRMISNHLLRRDKQ
jgi:hypothetical protein